MPLIYDSGGDNMGKKIFFSIILCSFLIDLWAIDARALAKQHGLSAASKVSVQWIRIFKKEKQLKKLGLEKLTDEEKKLLEKYLVEHAADSDSPEAAGI